MCLLFLFNAGAVLEDMHTSLDEYEGETEAESQTVIQQTFGKVEKPNAYSTNF